MISSGECFEECPDVVLLAYPPQIHLDDFQNTLHHLQTPDEDQGYRPHREEIRHCISAMTVDRAIEEGPRDHWRLTSKNVHVRKATTK